MFLFHCLATFLTGLTGILTFTVWGAPQAPVNEHAFLPDLAERILPTVVNISSTTVIKYSVIGMDAFLKFYKIPQQYENTSLGSGFILDTEGFVLTNNHVVEQATEVMVTLVDKSQFPTRIVGRDPKLDLSLLQIQPSDGKHPVLSAATLGDSVQVRIAEQVLAIGNPFGFQHTVTKGIISAKHRTIGIGPFDNFLQTDASINPGNSGGPLFNMKGEVIGINTVIFTRAEQSAGLGFAIPISEAIKVVPDLKKYGRVPRPWLGILAEPLTPARARYFKFPVKEGILIYNLVERGPAARAGVRPGDVIVKIGDAPVKDRNELERVLFTYKPSEKTRLSILRKTEAIEIVVPLQELPPRLESVSEEVI